jgi:hypothetical protein
MANRNATLYIRITEHGRSAFCKPVYQSKGRLKPQYAMMKVEPEHHKEGVYYVRLGTDGGKQQFVLVGKDPFVALDKLEEKKRWLRDRERKSFLQRLSTRNRGQISSAWTMRSSSISKTFTRRGKTRKPSVLTR